MNGRQLSRIDTSLKSGEVVARLGLRKERMFN